MNAYRDPSLDWHPVSAEELAAFGAALGQVVVGPLAGASLQSGRQAALPFYRAYGLLELMVAPRDAAPHPVYLLSGHPQGPPLWLDGSSGPIHTANHLEQPALDAPVVLAYLRFFMFFVRGQDGEFLLIESPAQFRRGKASAEHLTALQGLVEPPALPQRQEDGAYRTRILVVYGTQVFRADMLVAATGVVEMMDDEPLAEIDGAEVEWGVPLLAVPPALLEQAAGAPATREQSAPPAAPATDRDVTHAFVAVLLEEAIRAQLKHRLLQRFNSEAESVAPLEQLRRFTNEVHPVIAIESDIEYVEDLVKDILLPEAVRNDPLFVVRATHAGGSDGTYAVNTERRPPQMWLFSFHLHQKVMDMEWVAHALTLTPSTVLIGCASVRDIPDPLRRTVDLVLTLPRLTLTHFTRIFARIFGHTPDAAELARFPPGWQAYVLHTDFHAPAQLRMTVAEALGHIVERSQARLALVSVDSGPSLQELHGMAEARQVAEDLLADISAAQRGEIPWSAVDRGLLLVGKPGTGKTTLARAIARSCGIKFIQASAAQWQSTGNLDQHLRAIRACFAEARRYAPSILFIDEIDSIGNRETLEGSNAIYQTEVINAVLEQIQGMDERAPVIMLAATNFASKVDPALRRAGRLDQVVHVPLPNVPALREIFAFYLGPLRRRGELAADVDELLLAQLALGSSGADVEFFVRGAARRARKQRQPITQADLLAEVTRQPRHAQQRTRLPPDLLERVAYHEAGHVLGILHAHEDTLALSFVSIVPRLDGSLGFTSFVPEASDLLSRGALLERLRTFLAGRAAEEIIYGADRLSTGSGGGAGSDLAVATRLAASMVCEFAFGGQERLVWSGEPDTGQRQEIAELLQDAYARARALLLRERAALERLARALIERQELARREIDAVLAGG